MPNRMTALDASFLFMETASTPMHAGGVAVFTPPPGGFDHERLVRLIKQRIPFVPRYRQRIRDVPFGVARPVWVDDERFDVTYHVRRSALPKPGSREQLNELVARLMSRPLDRSRPLWEMYLVEGLADGNFAIVSKSHQALVDGLSAVDIAQVMLDPTEETGDGAGRQLAAAPRADRRRAAVAGVHRAHHASGRRGRGGARHRDRRVQDGGEVRGDAQRAWCRPPWPWPGRRWRARSTCPSASSGASPRSTCRSRTSRRCERRSAAPSTTPSSPWWPAHCAPGCRPAGSAVAQGDVIKAMLPISVAVSSAASGHAGGNRVSATLVELPVGEADPAVRLQQISYQLAQLEEGSQFVGADSIVNIAGFGPPTLHALGARVGSTMSSRVYNLVITNVPGPQRPLYAAGSRMVAAYPCVPLTKNQALSIGLISYDGGVYFGLYADRDALPDLDLLVTCINESMDELLARTEQSVRTLRVVHGKATRPKKKAQGST